MPIKTKNRLLKLAGEIGAQIANPIVIEDKKPMRFAESEMLGFLEKNIFRYSKNIYEGNVDDIEIFSATAPP